MKNLPYMRWFPADAESDEKYSSMSDEELGFFHRCLNKSWTNNGLPCEMASLAAMMRVTPRYLARVWNRVGPCWYQSEGRLYNRRQEEERTHARSKSESASNAVRTRYERRYERSANEPTNDLPRALARDSDSDSETTTTARGKPREPPTPIKRDVTSPSASEYPITASALSAADPTIDRMFAGQIITACVQAYCSVDDARFALTDELLAQAVGVASEKLVKGRKPGAGLLLKTTPNVIVNWARQGIPSPRHENNPHEVQYDQF